MIPSLRIVTGVFVVAVVGALFFRVGFAGAKRVNTGLWVGGYQYISEFQGRSLESSGEPNARLAFKDTDFAYPRSIAFDRHNNMWVAFFAADDNGGLPVVELNRGDIAALASRRRAKPHVILRGPEGSSIPFFTPISIAFDSSGDLWVADIDGKAIEEFLPKQIAHSGEPFPTVSITASDFAPEALRFDAADNLWVVRVGNPIQLCRFSQTDRATSGPPNPGLVVNLTDAVDPVDLAFDSSGNLWIAGNYSGADALEMLSAADLSANGETTPVPAVNIRSSAFGVISDTGSCLGGIDFDPMNNLWVSVGSEDGDCNSAQQVVEFTPAQLSAGGEVTPSVIIGQNSTKTNLFIPGPIKFGR